MDTKTNHIVKNVFSEDIKVPFGADLSASTDGTFSQAIQREALEAVVILLEHAKLVRANRVFGVATAAFRQAKNGELLANRISKSLGVDIRVISQEEEAELGFLTAIEITGQEAEHAIVWDIGGGSFQVSWKDGESLCTYMDSFGKIPMRDLILSEVQGKEVSLDATPNPISEEEAEKACSLLQDKLEACPENLKRKIKQLSTRVLGVGAIHHSNIFKSTGSEVYDLALLEGLIQERLGCRDEELGVGSGAKHRVSDLILVKSIMIHLGFEEVVDVLFFDDPDVVSAGNTAGMMTKLEYWK